MTVSTSSQQDFSRDALLTKAIRLTGILSAEEDATQRQLAQAADNLNIILDELQAADIILRTVERTTLTLANGTGEYSLDADTIDIECGLNDVIGTIVQTGGSEPIVKTMSRDEWLQIGNKTYAGMPTRAYHEKAGLQKLVFWPVPDAAYTFRYTRVRLLKSAGAGSNTLDLMRTWFKFLVFETASMVAYDNSLFSRGAQLHALAGESRPKAEANEVQHGKLRFRVGARGRNW